VGSLEMILLRNRPKDQFKFIVFDIAETIKNAREVSHPPVTLDISDNLPIDLGEIIAARQLLGLIPAREFHGYGV
jgi:hypothetical protein